MRTWSSRLLRAFVAIIVLSAVVPSSLAGAISDGETWQPPDNAAEEIERASWMSAEPEIVQQITSPIDYGSYSLSDSPGGAYSNDSNAIAAVAEALDLTGASSPTLTLWHRYDFLVSSKVVGRYALTDSPSGNYAPNTNAAAYLAQPVDLSSAVDPRLIIGHNYDLESYYDYGRVEVSSDGIYWSTLYSYTGSQSTTIYHAFSLSSYVGDSTVYVRLRLTSDSIIQRDGWIINTVYVYDYSTQTYLFYDSIEDLHLWTVDSPWGLYDGARDGGLVEASRDGVNWETLDYFWGYNDVFAEHSVDLAAFVGEPNVRLRFRTISDEAGTGDGWVIEGLSVDDGSANLFHDDCESDSQWSLAGGWGLYARPHVAFVRGDYLTVSDDLRQLVAEDRLYGFDTFNETNIDSLWVNLGRYATLLVDEDCMFYWASLIGEPIPTPDDFPIAYSFYTHKEQLRQWIYGGGGLFSTDQNDLSGTSEVTWTWLPDELQVTSIEDSSDPDRYGHLPSTLEIIEDPGLFTYPNQIDVTLVAENECHGNFTDYPGYTALVRDNVYGDVLEIYRRYGAGTVVLSHLEYETVSSYDVDYVENEIHFVSVSASVTANYPDPEGLLDIAAEGYCSVDGVLNETNTTSVAYEIHDGTGQTTPLAGPLAYDGVSAKWEADNVDVRTLEPGDYVVLVRFTDQNGHTGSGTAGFSKGVGSAEVGLLSPYTLQGKPLFVYATVWREDGKPDTSGGRVVTATLSTTTCTLTDSGTNGDMHANDGEYSAWCQQAIAETALIGLYVEGSRMDSTWVTAIDDPELIVLTDLQELYDEFIDTGSVHAEDLNGNRIVDFYDLLARLNEYAHAHRGVVLDLSAHIPGYANLNYLGSLSDRVEMGMKIDQLVYDVNEQAKKTRFLIPDLYSIDYVVILGDDQVVPFFRKDDPLGEVDGYITDAIWKDPDNPSVQDLEADKLLSDGPYSTRDAEIPTLYGLEPDMGLGRVFTQHPGQLVDIIEGYERPITLGKAAVFAENPVCWTKFLGQLVPVNTSWCDPEPNLSLIGQQYVYEHLEGDVVDIYRRVGDPFIGGNTEAWTADDVKNALESRDLTLILSHASHTLQHDSARNSSVNRSLYESVDASLETNGVLVSMGCFAGFTPSFAGSRPDVYTKTMALGPMNRSIAYIAATAYGKGNGGSILWVVHILDAKYSEQMMRHYADLIPKQQDVGTAFRKAITRYDQLIYDVLHSKTDEFVMYTQVMYGLPTQPIEDVRAASMASVFVLDADAMSQPFGAASVGSAVGEQTMAITVDIPVAREAVTPDGYTVFSFADGSSTSEPGGPILPYIIVDRQFPSGTVIHGVSLASKSSSVLPDTYNLVTSTVVSSIPVETPPVVLSNPYPSAIFSTSIYTDAVGSVSLTIGVVPMQYNLGTKQVIWYDDFVFEVSYDVPALPAAIVVGDAALADAAPAAGDTLTVQIPVSTTSSSNLDLEVGIAGTDGYTVFWRKELLNIPAGQSLVAYQVPTDGWGAGSYVLSLRYADPAIGNLVFKTDALDVTLAGISLDAGFAESRYATVNPTATMLALVRDETGNAISGLEDSFRAKLDGAMASPVVGPEDGDLYEILLDISTLNDGTHTIELAVTDDRGLSESVSIDFLLSTQRVMLPIVIRQ